MSFKHILTKLAEKKAKEGYPKLAHRLIDSADRIDASKNASKKTVLSILIEKYVPSPLSDHTDDEGRLYDYEYMDEYNAPQKVLRRWYEWLRDDHGVLHEDDDRDTLWEKFLIEQENARDEAQAREMGEARKEWESNRPEIKPGFGDDPKTEMFEKFNSGKNQVKEAAIEDLMKWQEKHKKNNKEDKIDKTNKAEKKSKKDKSVKGPKDKKEETKFEKTKIEKKSSNVINAGDLLKKYAIDLGLYQGDRGYEHEGEDYGQEFGFLGDEYEICASCHFNPASEKCHKCKKNLCEECEKYGPKGPLCEDCHDDYILDRVTK